MGNYSNCAISSIFALSVFLYINHFRQYILITYFIQSIHVSEINPVLKFFLHFLFYIIKNGVYFKSGIPFIKFIFQFIKDINIAVFVKLTPGIRSEYTDDYETFFFIFLF